MNIKSIVLSVSSVAALSAAVLFCLPTFSAEKSAVLSSADEKFVKEAGAGGMAEVKLAQLGVAKASTAEMKAFAQQIVDDHTKGNVEIKALATGKGVELSTVIDPDSAKTYQNLEKATGADFDKQFTAEVVSDHTKCQSAFEAAVKDSTDNEVRALAEKMLPNIKAHLEKAKELTAK